MDFVLRALGFAAFSPVAPNVVWFYIIGMNGTEYEFQCGPFLAPVTPALLGLARQYFQIIARKENRQRGCRGLRLDNFGPALEPFRQRIPLPSLFRIGIVELAASLIDARRQMLIFRPYPPANWRVLLW